ncbi:MAG TPA: radical SAM protein [Acidimicrobiales bacterium]|nr:radical SAM protein [Acidimicrobiales bacterium]
MTRRLIARLTDSDPCGSEDHQPEHRGFVYPPVYQHQPPPLPEGYEPPSGRPPIRLHEIDLYVTMRCNIRCQFCNVRAGEYDHEDLPAERICSMLDEAARLGLREIHFLGGEPALRRDLEDLIAHAADLGLHTRIISNGMRLPASRLRNLVDAGLHEIMISVDGLEATHNRLRRAGPDGWVTTMATVREAIAAGLRTRVSTVAYIDNREEILDLMRLVEGMGAHIFSVFLGSPLGRGHTMLDRVVDPLAWRELQDEVTAATHAMRPDFSVVMEQGFAWVDRPAVDRSQLKGRGTGCNTLLEDFDYLIVRSDGNLYQCVFFMTEGPPIGNVRHQPLEATLHHALDVATYRPFTVANDRCSGCLHSGDCGTGCRGYAYLYTGDWLRTDPRCSKKEPSSEQTPPYYPLCPIMKLNVRSGLLGGSTEQALERSVVT